jgi:hypothetical protein
MSAGAIQEAAGPHLIDVGYGSGLQSAAAPHKFRPRQGGMVEAWR